MKSKDAAHNLTLSPEHVPTSEVLRKSDNNQWRDILELQNRNMIELIKAIQTPCRPLISLLEFNPEQPNVDPRVQRAKVSGRRRRWRVDVSEINPRLEP
ncbi:hypothetical protein EVAR_54825_1 [Eumeta japonica]|uniref:Uncharacterized protein n=1 Tax=Eumeta variegata TaxID=151549 RepID=A0A4C1Y0I2_EUMVA|nr:hypothetical protein EVAR_54825_1 [Eumeta japonica]